MFTLDEIVPWGRSFDEYRHMFSLTDADLGRRIIGCGDGPASFNAEATRRGGHVISCDPLYQFDSAAIQQRITATYDEIVDQTRQNENEFVWDTISTVDELGRIRMRAMQDFLADYDEGRAAGRYVPAALPALPFSDGQFELALCSHFLFLYSSQLGAALHIAALLEMCRVATDVRVFPLLALSGHRSPFVDACARQLRAAGCAVDIRRVDYEFQRGADQMLLIRPASIGSANPSPERV